MGEIGKSSYVRVIADFSGVSSTVQLECSCGKIVKVVEYHTASNDRMLEILFPNNTYEWFYESECVAISRKEYFKEVLRG